MVGCLTLKDRTCVKYGSHVINQDSTSLQDQDHQDQARTQRMILTEL